MIALGKEYMQENNITDTQYILVRHLDNGNPHVHLIYNRIDNNGRVISDKHDRYRNEIACKKIKDKYSLTYGKSKKNVKRRKLKGKDKTKYQVHDAVKDAMQKATNWNSLEALLKNKRIDIAYKYKGQTDEVQGISFTIGNITFKGSVVDRSFSYSKLDKLLQDKTLKHKKKEERGQSQNKTNNQIINNKSKGIKR